MKFQYKHPTVLLIQQKRLFDNDTHAFIYLAIHVPCSF